MSARLFALAASASGLALLIAAPAMAQVVAPAEPAASVDEIVVTAQRRSENIRDVPFAVTAINTETLNAISSGGSDILALAGRVPSLHVESSNGRYAPRFYIRGLGNVDFDFNASQPVSVVLDDVVLENVYLKGFPLFDVKQVEVLRGPQGTLFGRNTPAGVVKIDTIKPGEDFTGFGSLAYGNYGSTRAEVGVTLPASDTLSVRVAGLWNHRDDWVNNAYDAPFAKKDGKDLGNFDDFAGRIHVAWTPTDRLSSLLTLQARDYEGTGTMNRANVLTKGSNKLNDNFDRDTVWYDGGRNNFQKQQTTSQSLQVAYDFGPATLTGIVGSFQGWSQGDGDIDGGVASAAATASYKTPFNSETGTLSSDLLQNTYELRLSSNGEGRLGWQVGAGSLAGKVTEEIIVTGQEPCGWAAVLGRTAFVGAQSLADVSGELHGRGPVLRHLGVAHSRCAGRAQCEQGKARQGQGHQHLDHRQAVLTAQLHADTPLARSAARPCIETHTTRTKLALPAPLGVRIKLWAAARRPLCSAGV